jgi:predicted ATPase
MFIFKLAGGQGGHMLITKIFIEAFKSIRSLTLPLDEHITVLIGPNESGKTNILKAIETFKADTPLDTELTCQYSDYYESEKLPLIGFEVGHFTREDKSRLVKLYDGFRLVDSFIVYREGPNLADYKIQTDDKIISIGNIKPLFNMMPKIVYFDSIPIIKDRIDLESLVKKIEQTKTMRNLLKVGGIEEPEIIFKDSMHGRRATEEASREITRRIRRVWSQEPTLEIKLRVNGKLLYIDFSDSTTVYDTPKSRSPGFLWYLSFYINFCATTSEAKIHEYLFLLDEPGLHLHPSGQKDLTHLLEGLSDKSQLIYTTHSPFMINRSHPHRVRVVTKESNGTIVDNEAYRENWRPLRKSIGLTVGDLFFFNNRGIVFEIPHKGPFQRIRSKKKDNLK